MIEKEPNRIYFMNFSQDFELLQFFGRLNEVELNLEIEMELNLKSGAGLKFPVAQLTVGPDAPQPCWAARLSRSG
jgi:hypothetical protein